MHIYYLVHFFKANVNIFDFVDEVLFQAYCLRNITVRHFIRFTSEGRL